MVTGILRTRHVKTLYKIAKMFRGLPGLIKNMVISIQKLINAGSDWVEKL